MREGGEGGRERGEGGREGEREGDRRKFKGSTDGPYDTMNFLVSDIDNVNVPVD